jgi:hypothetical protein
LQAAATNPVSRRFRAADVVVLHPTTDARDAVDSATRRSWE